MDIFTAIASFFVIWWISFFFILPIGIKTQQEDGIVVKGSAKSAPSNPQIKKKMLYTTGLASFFWLILFLTVNFNIIKL